jgi:hypothetical protein
MTSARKASLLRFLFWFLYALVIGENPTRFGIHEILSILALFELLIACSPFLDNEKSESEKKYENTLDNK